MLVFQETAPESHFSTLPLPEMRLELALDFAPGPVQLRMLTAGPFNAH